MQCNVEPSTKRDCKEEVSKNDISKNRGSGNLMEMEQKHGITYNHCSKNQTMNAVTLFTLIAGKNTDPHNNIGNGKEYGKKYGEETRRGE